MVHYIRWFYNLYMGVTKMNQYVTGTVIRELREKNNMTQLQLAEKLGVSDKTVSKWETASVQNFMYVLYAGM